MKITVNKPTEIEVTAIRCVLPVNYGEEDIQNDFPFRKGDVLDITIDLDTHTILDWPRGKVGDVEMKVCDQGSYYLMSGKKVIAKKENDYVPDCIPGEYGDYVVLRIDKTGKITNWDTTDEDVARSFFPNDAD